MEVRLSPGESLEVWSGDTKVFSTNAAVPESPAAARFADPGIEALFTEPTEAEITAFAPPLKDDKAGTVGQALTWGRFGWSHRATKSALDLHALYAKARRLISEGSNSFGPWANVDGGLAVYLVLTGLEEADGYYGVGQSPAERYGRDGWTLETWLEHQLGITGGPGIGGGQA